MRRKAAIAGACLAAFLSITSCDAGEGAGQVTTTPPIASATTAAIQDVAATPTTPAEQDGDRAGGRVTFTTQDGFALEGAIFGTAPDWVVLAHMRPADMESWFSFAEGLVSEGFTAFAFNFRGYGASQGSGFAVDVDTTAAVDFALASGATTVSIVGASMGGTGAVAAAAERDVRALVTISAPAAFEGVDGPSAMASVTAQTLLVAAAGDEPYASDVAVLAAAAPGPVNTLFLDGNAHGTDLFRDHAAELTDQILAHLRSSLE